MLRVADRAQKAHVMDEELQSLAKKAAVEQSIHKGKGFGPKFSRQAQGRRTGAKIGAGGRAKTGEQLAFVGGSLFGIDHRKSK